MLAYFLGLLFLMYHKDSIFIDFMLLQFAEWCCVARATCKFEFNPCFDQFDMYTSVGWAHKNKLNRDCCVIFFEGKIKSW